MQNQYMFTSEQNLDLNKTWNVNQLRIYKVHPFWIEFRFEQDLNCKPMQSQYMFISEQNLDLNKTLNVKQHKIVLPFWTEFRFDWANPMQTGFWTPFPP